MQLGALGAVPVFALIALLGGASRLAPLLLTAGGAGCRTDPAAAGRRRPSDRAYPRRAAAGRPQCRAGLSGDPCCGGGRSCHRRPGERAGQPAAGLAGRRPGRYRAGQRAPTCHHVAGVSVGRVVKAAVNFAVGVTPKVPDEIQLRPPWPARDAPTPACVRSGSTVGGGADPRRGAWRHASDQSSWTGRSRSGLVATGLAACRLPPAGRRAVSCLGYPSGRPRGLCVPPRERAGVNVPPLIATWSAGAPTVGTIMGRGRHAGRPPCRCSPESPTGALVQVALLKSLASAGSLPPRPRNRRRRRAPMAGRVGRRRSRPRQATRSPLTGPRSSPMSVCWSGRLRERLAASVFGSNAVADMPALQLVASAQRPLRPARPSPGDIARPSPARGPTCGDRHAQGDNATPLPLAISFRRGSRDGRLLPSRPPRPSRCHRVSPAWHQAGMAGRSRTGHEPHLHPGRHSSGGRRTHQASSGARSPPVGRRQCQPATRPDSAAWV